MQNYLVAMAVFACFYALLALGLNLVWGMAGMINLGLVGFFAFGAYVSALATVNLAAPVPPRLAAAPLLPAGRRGGHAPATRKLRGGDPGVVAPRFSGGGAPRA